MTEPLPTDSQTGAGTPAPAPSMRTSGPAARARRSWPYLAVVAVLVVGLSYEFLRYDHVVAGHLLAAVVAGVLGVGLVVVLADRGLSRVGRGVIGLAVSIGVLFAVAQLRLAPDPLLGDWDVTIGPAAVATITRGAEGYVVTTKTSAGAVNSTCTMPPGQVVATFAGTGPSYPAQHALVNPLTCTFVQWAPATYTLGDRTIDIAFADHWRFIMTKVK
jgi:hypothetical protein